MTMTKSNTLLLAVALFLGVMGSLQAQKQKNSSRFTHGTGLIFDDFSRENLIRQYYLSHLCVLSGKKEDLRFL